MLARGTMTFASTIFLSAETKHAMHCIGFIAFIVALEAVAFRSRFWYLPVNNVDQMAEYGLMGNSLRNTID